MSILDRDALEDSPLADLHAIASALSIDGYRRLRRPELIDAILARQDGEEPSADTTGSEEVSVTESSLTEAVVEELRAEDGATPGARRRRSRRGGRGRAANRDEAEARSEPEPQDEEQAAQAAGDTEAHSEGAEDHPTAAEETIVQGVVELLPNGSGFLRVNPPDSSDDDAYISAAQVKRCELVPGDRISGPRRPPRRSERYASMIRIDTINDRPADEVVVSTHFDELPAEFPHERFRLGSDDPTVKAIEWLSPFGRGSRVTIAGPSQSGKTEAIRRLAAELAAQEGIELSLVLAGIRPEELREWGAGSSALEPATALSFDASADAQSQAVERIVDRGRRLASRGADAVVLIDSLDGLAPATARRAIRSARKLVDGGSLTVIATATSPVGGETTVIALDRALTSAGRFPALDLATSWTMHPERLVGDVGAEAIVAARAQAFA